MASMTLDRLISEESLGFLGEVKKGKPRKFVLVHKGAKIVSLVVYKMGSLESYKKEAKATGKGEVSHGVILGKGAHISFQLAREDGFDKAPTKNSALKQFLTENTDEKFKPTFEIVDALPVVSDDEPAADSGPPADATQQTEQLPAEKSAIQLQLETRLKEIAPRAVPYSKAGGAKALDVATLLTGVQANRQSAQFEAGLEKLSRIERLMGARSSDEDGARQRFETLLKELAPQAMPIAQGGGPHAAEMTGLLKAVHGDRKSSNFVAGLEKLEQVQAYMNGSAATDDDAKQRFLALLKELAPQAIPIAKGASPFAAQVEALLKAVKEDGNNKEYSAGLEKLMELHQFLAVPPAPPADLLEKQFANLLKDLAPQAVKLAKAGGPDAVELASLLKAVQADRERGAFDAGLEKLSRVREILDTDSRPKRDFTQQRAAFAAATETWQAAIEQVGGQLERMAAAFRNIVGANRDNQNLSGLLTDLEMLADVGLPALTKHFRVPLAAAIFDVQKASADSISSVAAAGAARANEFLNQLLTDSAFAAVDANPFGVNVTTRSSLEPTLKELRDGFQSLTT